MPAPQDDRIDVAALAAEGATATRRYPLRDFRRLADVLVASGGDAVVQFRFVQAAAGVAGCELELLADASLRCERCLEPFVETLRSATRLAFVVEGRSAGSVPAGFEELVVPPGPVSLRDLVEDELLLALPLVARHGADTQCALGAQPEGDDDALAPDAAARRPFAGLRTLLKT